MFQKILQGGNGGGGNMTIKRKKASFRTDTAGNISASQFENAGINPYNVLNCFSYFTNNYAYVVTPFHYGETVLFRVNNTNDFGAAVNITLEIEVLYTDEIIDA